MIHQPPANILGLDNGNILFLGRQSQDLSVTTEVDFNANSTQGGVVFGRITRWTRAAGDAHNGIGTHLVVVTL